MCTSYQKDVRRQNWRQRFLVLEDGTAWKVTQLGRRVIQTGHTSARHSCYFPPHISRPSKFERLQHLRMGMIDGTKEKVWWSINPRNVGYNGKVSTFVESSKENKTRKLQYMIFVCIGRCWTKCMFPNKVLDTVPSIRGGNDDVEDGLPFHSDLQGETFYDKKLRSMCLCVHEVFNYMEKKGGIFRPLTFTSKKDYYFLSCEEIESRIENPDSHLSECELRLKRRRESKKSKFQAIKKRKKKLAKAKRRSHDAKMQRNFDFQTIRN